MQLLPQSVGAVPAGHLHSRSAPTGVPTCSPRTRSRMFTAVQTPMALSCKLQMAIRSSIRK